MVEGKPLDWDLQREVALIPNDIWEQGKTAVAREIERIMERMGFTYDTLVRENSGNMEETARFDPSQVETVTRITRKLVPSLERNEETQKWRLPEPIETSADIAAFHRKAVGEALEHALDMAGPNGVQASSDEVIWLRRNLDGETDIRLLAASFGEAELTLKAKIASGEYPAESSLTVLTLRLRAGIVGMSDADPGTKAYVESMDLLPKFAAPSAEDKEVIQEAMEGIRPELEPSAERPMDDATAEAVDLDKPSNTSMTRLTHWYSEISIWIDEGKKHVGRYKFVYAILAVLYRLLGG